MYYYGNNPYLISIESNIFKKIKLGLDLQMNKENEKIVTLKESQFVIKDKFIVIWIVF